VCDPDASYSHHMEVDSDAAGEFDIWVIGADGGKPVRMTTHPANDGNPSWSHDGRWIYFDLHERGSSRYGRCWPMEAKRSS